MTKFSIIVASVIFSFILLLNFNPAKVMAVDCSASNLTTEQAIRCGANDASGNPSNTNPKKIDDTIASAINILSVIVGLVAVIMIIIGGFRYITSGGSAERISGAKNTLIYALIGLIIVTMAQIIARFILKNIT